MIVERPTYDRTLLSLTNRGADVRMVELEQDGIDVAALERVLAAGAEPKLAHIIPNFQNPAGYTLSAAKRERLIELAATYEFTIFEDDPYVALRFEGERCRRCSRWTAAGRVRLFVLQDGLPGDQGRLPGRAGGRHRAGGEARHQTYISPNMVSQSIVHEFCESGALERSIETVKAALHERAKTLGDALSRELPDARFKLPQGGYFMWVDLPRGTDVAALFDAAGQRGVQFVKGTDFVLDGAESSLRLAYSGVTPEEIEDGVSRLAEAYGELSSAADAA